MIDMMHGFYYGGGWGWIGFLLNAVLWALIIAFIIWLVIRLSRGGHMMMHNYHDGQNALDIAKERYAKGEIEHDEFERIKKNLS
jgi:putative membrane protein